MNFSRLRPLWINTRNVLKPKVQREMRTSEFVRFTYLEKYVTGSFRIMVTVEEISSIRPIAQLTGSVNEMVCLSPDASSAELIIETIFSANKRRPKGDS